MRSSPMSLIVAASKFLSSKTRERAANRILCRPGVTVGAVAMSSIAIAPNPRVVLSRDHAGALFHGNKILAAFLRLYQDTICPTKL
jgi:hypothetical protein